MMGTSCFFFAIVLLQVFRSSPCVHAKELKTLSFIKCKKHELDALLKFKHSFTQDPMNRLSSWVGDDCCQWLGVTCDNVTDNVVKLNLRSQPQPYDNVVGDDVLGCLPDPQVSMVSSGVSSALLELKHLTHLDLSGNNFSESQIPEFIGSLRQLKYLNLSSAGFSGLIPPQLGNLRNLVHLDLHAYDLCFTPSGLYAEGFRWASGLSELQSLDMSCYNLSRAHDTFKVLSTLPSLSALILFNCLLDNSHLSEAYFPTLKHLDLGSNRFKSPLPPVLKNMVSLRSLYLNNNQFNGSIPLWFKAMRSLEVLDLSFNEFNYVEGGIMGIMGSPCSFKHLDLSSNMNLQGDILVSFMSLSQCGAFEFEFLDLHYNSLNGSLPSSLGQLTNLYHLDLSWNEFKGGVPASFVNLSSLKYLDLSKNKLTGRIPDFIGHLTQIKHLDISSNSLQGTVTGIGNLSKLLYLDMNFNNLNLILTSSLNWRPPFQLLVFNVHSCMLNTVFPQWLKNQTRITFLDLSNTGISGELPRWLWNLSNLRTIHLSGNQLTGSLPQHIARDWSYTGHLEWLDLHNNLLSGTIPKWLFNLEFAEVIDLSSNQLTGAIFDGNNASSLFIIATTLYMLDLSDNRLSGEIQFGIPFGMGFADAELQILSLQGNHFNGPIPSQLCDFKWLTVLVLGHNRLTGHIPRCLASMPFSMAWSIADEFNDSHVEITEIVKGVVEVSTGNSKGQSMIDFSSNYLIGTIPEELTNISALLALNLSYNHLTGHIPGKIGNLKELESLDLSNNHLSGTIPQSLSTISWLGKLNLSNNNLHGLIPTGNQLQTLDDPSIYAGNSGLCGFPLPNCNKLESPPSLTNVNPTTGKDDVEKEDKYDKMLFILAVMSVVATGFWGVVGTLVIKRSWRQAYFRYVEDLADRIYVPVKVRVNKFKRRFNENS